jgi:hypothetical protein
LKINCSRHGIAEKLKVCVKQQLLTYCMTFVKELGKTNLNIPTGNQKL